MKKTFIVLGLLALALGGALGYTGLAAATGDDGSPGSAGDPLVTRSFVVQYVKEALGKSGGQGGALAWSVVNLQAGEEFIGKAGTEFIVRTGSAAVVDPTGGGIPDLTAGKNVLAGQVAENNHLFTIPRDDGRGIKAATPVVLMYRGL